MSFCKLQFCFLLNHPEIIFNCGPKNTVLLEWGLWNCSNVEWCLHPATTDERSLKIRNHSVISRPLPPCVVAFKGTSQLHSHHAIEPGGSLSSVVPISTHGEELERMAVAKLWRKSISKMQAFAFLLFCCCCYGCCCHCARNWTQGLLHARQVLHCHRVMCLIIGTYF